MGYGLARWHEPMIKLAFTQGLRIICPIRAGYGLSENIDPKADVLKSTREDTLQLLDNLGIDRLPYLTQGNDLIFAADLAVHHPEKVSEIIGLCARPCLPGDRHYANMGKWHRFFLSTAKHAPHLLKFTTRAGVVMARRVGAVEMFRQLNGRSPADTALLEDDALLPVLKANAQLIVGKSTNVAQAYAHEILATEADWTNLMEKCVDRKIWCVNGGQDPATDIATIAEYREAYPWIDIEVIPDAGQMLIYQHYEYLIPRIAKAARDV
jgi:pimeloyl-ACP methyl ester carboxylesterase